MKTLDSILGKFVDLKEELLDFISDTRLDNTNMRERNEEYQCWIKDNEASIDANTQKIKQANRSIKQINKLIGA